MNSLFRMLCSIGTLAAVACAAPTAAWAQEDFPSRPIRIIVPYTAGTGADLLARIVGEAMAPTLGQAIVIENRPGAGGMVGTAVGAKAKADGYTLTVATPGTMSIIPAMNANANYSDRDFVGVGALARSAYVVVGPATPEAPNTFGELITRIRAGGATYGIPGLGSTTHLAGEIVLKQAALKATPVPYPGSPQMLTDIVADRVTFGFNTVGATLSLVKSGKLRALAVTSSERASSLPGVPTAAEAAFPGLDVVGWWGLVAPAETPAPALRKLSDALVKALSQPDVRAKFAAQEVDPYLLATAEFTNLMRTENPLWAGLVKEHNLKAN